MEGLLQHTNSQNIDYQSLKHSYLYQLAPYKNRQTFFLFKFYVRLTSANDPKNLRGNTDAIVPNPILKKMAG